MRNSGLPPAAATRCRSARPGAHPRTDAASRVTSSSASGPRCSSRPPVPTSLSTRWSRCGGRGGVRTVTTRVNAVPASRRASAGSARSVATSAHCTSSRTRTTGSVAARRSSSSASAATSRKPVSPGPVAASLTGAASRSAVRSTPSGRSRHSSSPAAPRNTAHRCDPPSASSSNRLLPMPGSPSTTSTRPAPRAVSCSAASIAANSSDRPTNGRRFMIISPGSGTNPAAILRPGDGSEMHPGRVNCQAYLTPGMFCHGTPHNVGGAALSG